MKLISVKSYKLSNILGKKKSIVFLMMVILVNSFTLIIVDSSVLSFLCIALIAISMAVMEPMIIDIKNKSIVSKNRATILSIYSMIGSIISAAIKPVIGFSSNTSLGNGLIICASISLVSIILIGYFIKITDNKYK